jgi:hypothetical protein
MEARERSSSGEGLGDWEKKRWRTEPAWVLGAIGGWMRVVGVGGVREFSREGVDSVSRCEVSSNSDSSASDMEAEVWEEEKSGFFEPDLGEVGSDF